MPTNVDDLAIPAPPQRTGDAQNIIPERAVLQASVRAEDPQALLEDVKPRVENCARGAALAAGAEVEIDESGPTYLSIQRNPVLEALVERSYHTIGRKTEPHRAEVFPGSTDMGNVSQVVPSIHPNIEIIPGLTMHSRRATELVGGENGDKAVLDGALMLALTASQLFRHPALVALVKEHVVEGVRSV